MELDFDKINGLIPAVIQDNHTGKVLMLGFMNRKALEITRETGKATFYSRTRKKLWTKGEESGHFLHVRDIKTDCDHDTLLIKADPEGPVCHLNRDTCFDEDNTRHYEFLFKLQEIIDSRREEMPEGSYTSRLFGEGPGRMAQKVGEEAVELIIASVRENKQEFLNEAADLLYHMMVLLSGKGFSLGDIENVLEKRHKK